MSIQEKAMDLASKILKVGINIVGGNRAMKISAQLAEALLPIVSQRTDFGTIKFFCPGKLPEWRARTLLTREPETRKWIASFQDDDILWDIGANVGAYSLYAAMKGHAVSAFEPSPANYYVLSRNVDIDGLDGRIAAYCLAFNDITKLDTFFMANTELGAALNSFGEAFNCDGKPYGYSLKQAMLGFSIDDFMEKYDPPFPNHIKIDVDGIEKKIINGAKNTLEDRRLKSLLVEIHTDRTEYFDELIEIFDNFGFYLFNKDGGDENPIFKR